MNAFRNPDNLIDLQMHPRREILIAKSDIEDKEECYDFFHYWYSLDSGKNWLELISFVKQLSFEVNYFSSS